MMEKQANFNWWLMVPGAGLVNPDLVKDTGGLPDLFKGTGHDRQLNSAAWHTIGSTATLSALIIAMRLAANAAAKKDLEKARQRAHENKINAMYAYSTPNTAPQAEAVKKVRSLGVSKDASAEGITKKAFNWGEVAVRTAPIALSIPAMLAVSKIVDDATTKEDKEEADQRLAEARNKLDALQAQLLKLRMAKSASAIEDIPAPEESVEEESENTEEEKRKNQQENRQEAQNLKREIADLEAKVGVNKEASGGIWEFLTSHLFLASALTAGLSGALMYTITKDKDEARKRKKLLEKQVYAQNLTNTPPKIELLLGKHQPFPDDESRQNYIKEISSAVK